MSRSQTNGEPSCGAGCGERTANAHSALVLGGANSLWDDLAKAEALFTPDIIIATNHAGFTFRKPFDFWVSYHPDKFPEWIGKRRSNGYPLPAALVTARHRENLAAVKRDMGIPLKFIDSWGGSSGLLSVQLALGLGCQKVVLAGVPLDKRAAHFDGSQSWAEASKYRQAWVDHRKDMGDRVRSFGGWTAEVLGAPDTAWICR